MQEIASTVEELELRIAPSATGHLATKVNLETRVTVHWATKVNPAIRAATSFFSRVSL